MSQRRARHWQLMQADRMGRNDLHYAAAEGRVADVKAAVDSGADPSLADEAGWTPLHFAAQAQDSAAARLLIEAGAHVDAKDAHGKTPLAVALFNVRDGEGEVIEVLLAAGASPDTKNNAGVSPRDLAERVANYDLSQHLPPASG